MVTMPEDSLVVVQCAGPGNGKKCPAKLAMTRDELREINDAGGSVRCPGCERKRKEGERKRAAGGRTTVFDTILLALADCVTADRSDDLDINDLIVAAWGLDRQRLGLRKYERTYPDGKRIEVAVVNMVKAGLLARTGPCRVTLTEAGRKRAAVLAERRRSV